MIAGHPGTRPPGRETTVVIAEPIAPTQMTKTMPQYGPFPRKASFAFSGVKEHQEYSIHLALGSIRSSLSVSIAFTPAPNLSSVHQTPSTITLYASAVEKPSVLQYRYQIEVDHFEVSDGAKTVLAWSECSDTLFLAVYPHHPLERVVVECTAGAEVPREYDLLQIWRIATLHAADPDDIIQFRQWVWERHNKLTCGGESTIDSCGRSPLHHAAASLGDPALVKLMLKDYRKFMNPLLKDREGKTALHYLCSTPGLTPSSHSRVGRATLLAKLLVHEGDCTASEEDIYGNNPLHYACVHYAGAKGFLELVASSSPAALNMQNNAGRTPLAECEKHHLPDIANEVKEVFEAVVARGSTTLPEKTLKSYTPMIRDSVAPVHETKSRVPPVAPELHVKNNEGLPLYLDEDVIMSEFKKYDVDGSGYISANEMKALYKNYESYGVAPSEAELEEAIKSLGIMDDGRVTYEEFSVLMLKLERR